RPRPNWMQHNMPWLAVLAMVLGLVEDDVPTRDEPGLDGYARIQFKEFVRLGQNCLQTQQGDTLDLGACGRKLFFSTIGHPTLENGGDRCLVVIARVDDEGEAELFDIGIVERGEALALVIGQGIEAGRRLFGGAFSSE